MQELKESFSSSLWKDFCFLILEEASSISDSSLLGCWIARRYWVYQESYHQGSLYHFLRCLDLRSTPLHSHIHLHIRHLVVLLTPHHLSSSTLVFFDHVLFVWFLFVWKPHRMFSLLSHNTCLFRWSHQDLVYRIKLAYSCLKFFFSLFFEPCHNLRILPFWISKIRNRGCAFDGKVLQHQWHRNLFFVRPFL